MEKRSNPKQNNRRIGAFGEAAACNYLLEKHYRIIEKNFRIGKLGELDIIASTQNTLCFIEVKSRKSIAFGTPAESVNFSKMRTIRRLASIYLSNLKKQDCSIRFDVIEVMLEENKGVLQVKEILHIENAF